MKGPSVALLASTIGLVGCTGPAELLFKNSIVVDHLEGNYQRLARCTYEHLARQKAQLSMSDLREQETVIVDKSPANLLGALVRQRRWRQADATGTHVRLFPKRAHPRIGARVRRIAGAPMKMPLNPAREPRTVPIFELGLVLSRTSRCAFP